jgi:hypothetical protein
MLWVSGPPQGIGRNRLTFVAGDPLNPPTLKIVIGLRDQIAMVSDGAHVLPAARRHCSHEE